MWEDRWGYSYHVSTRLLRRASTDVAVRGKKKLRDGVRRQGKGYEHLEGSWERGPSRANDGAQGAR